MESTADRSAALNGSARGIASDDLRYSLRIAVWVRWFAGIAWLVQHNYRPDFDSGVYVPNMLLVLSLLVFNAYVHYRIRANRALTWHWALALSAMDVIAVTAGLAISGGFNNGFFVLYYPAIATFAVVFASFRLSFAWVTMVAVMYAVLSFVVDPTVDFDAKMEKVLFIRIVTMFAVVAAVNLIMRLERTRRREAVERERELQQERIELSQTIHDTIAQSAYMIGLGLETAIELASAQNDENRDELLAKLSATHALSKSTMWELRHPIDVGPIFEGRELSRVLRSHASTFTTITSIPTDAGPVWARAGAIDRQQEAAVLDSPQRDDQRLPPLECKQSPNFTEFRGTQTSNVGSGRRSWPTRRLPRAGTRLYQDESRRRANGRQAGNVSRRGGTGDGRVLHDSARCRPGRKVD